MKLINKIEKMIEVIRAYQKASTKFIDKVESGRARSVETYNDLKLCNELANKLNLPDPE